MRKVLVLAGLVFLVSLMAANAGTTQSAQPVPDVHTFLAGLAGSPETPAPIQRTACSVSLECICGGGTVTISCSGDVSCHVGPRYVMCDGVSEHCPPIGSCPH